MSSWRFILSINKFSKYGIVLVAANTVATVAQSNSVSRLQREVYADEIAGTAPKTSEVPSITPATRKR